MESDLNKRYNTNTKIIYINFDLINTAKKTTSAALLSTIVIKLKTQEKIEL